MSPHSIWTQKHHHIGTDMSFSSYGLAIRIIMLLFLFSQGNPQCYRPQMRSPGHVIPSCCTSTSNKTINGPVNACFEQRNNTFSHCKVHAFIFTKNKLSWCVDPTAPWLEQRFQKLKAREICCQLL